MNEIEKHEVLTTTGIIKYLQRPNIQMNKNHCQEQSHSKHSHSSPRDEVHPLYLCPALSEEEGVILTPPLPHFSCRLLL